MKTKAEKIRKLYDGGFIVAEIASMLGIRYQHAYNVIKEYEKSKAKAQNSKKIVFLTRR